MYEFVELLKALLVQEHHKTEEEALGLLAKYPMIVINGFMTPNMLGPTAWALYIKDSE